METIYRVLPRIHRYRFHFTAARPVRLPRYPGSTWRGLFGHGLRRAACVTGRPDCGGCPLAASCVYQRVFESRAPDPSSPSTAAHPFVLDVRFSPPEPARDLELGLTLFEPALDAFPFILHGLAQAASRGIGRERVPLRLERTLRQTAPGSGQWRELSAPDGKPSPMPPPATPSEMTIVLETPLRMKRRGRLVGAAEFESAHFLRQLWRRIAELGDARLSGVAVPLPELRAEQVETLDKRLRWRELERYSSRQRTAMKIGGLTGRWTLRHQRLAEWWPMIWHGQWLHLGRFTSAGLGRYRVERS